MTDQTTDNSTRTILNDIEDFMGRFVAFSDPDHSRILALWVLHTHCFDAAYSTPYVYVTSAEPQCGKTRLIETVMMLAKDARLGSQVTNSSLFRLIEAYRPTLFLDEVDAIFTGQAAAEQEMRGMLNSGYKHNGTILRTIPGKSEDESGVASFSTFCPKLLAGIDNAKLPDTIADRCIRITLKRKRADQTVERMIPRKVEPQAEELRSRIEEWAKTHFDSIVDYEPDYIEEISDRAFEISEPLLQITMELSIEIAQATKGSEQSSAFRNSVKASLVNLLTAEEKPMTPGAQVLKAAQEIMDETGHKYVTSAALMDRTGHNGKRLGALLTPYGIKSTVMTLPGGAKVRAYYRTDFEDAWSRYL